MIVFGERTCYLGYMRSEVDQKPQGPRVSRIQRALVSLIAIAYLFVGLIHATAHANETIGITAKAVSTAISLEIQLAATDNSDDADFDKQSAGGEYCQVYAPILVPLLEPVAAPAALIVKPMFAEPARLFADCSRLDTPPPKRLV